MLHEALIVITSVAMLAHVLAIISGVVVVKKYEQRLQNLSFTCMFNVNDFTAHKLWFVILSLVVSFGYLILGAGLFVKAAHISHSLSVLENALMNLSVGILITQYNYFVLRDRRK